jgi:hypothetical protein
MGGKGIIYETLEFEQERQCTYNITWRCIHETTVAMEKQ